MAVSIKDVAKLAGVTTGTVSRAFNHYSDILPETKERIMTAARELGYVPNATARSLSAKRPPNICLIVSNIQSGDDRDAMLFLLLKGVISYAREHYLELTLYSLDSAEQQNISFTDYCSLHSISGAIITGVRTDDPYFTELIHSGIPVVGIDLPIAGEKTGWVSINNRAAAGEAVEALFRKGFERLLIVEGSPNTAVNAERLEGVSEAYRATGRKLDESSTCVSYVSRTIEGEGKIYQYRKINPELWIGMEGIEQRDNIAIACPERAFLDVMYLSAGNCYFDNLRPLSKKRVRELLPLYRSAVLTERVNKLLNNPL